MVQSDDLLYKNRLSVRCLGLFPECSQLMYESSTHLACTKIDCQFRCCPLKVTNMGVYDFSFAIAGVQDTATDLAIACLSFLLDPDQK